MKRLAVVLLLLFGACAQRSAADVVSSAPGAATTKGTAAISMTSISKLVFSGRTVTTTSKGDGVTEFASRKGKMRLTVSTDQVPIRFPPCDLITNDAVVYVSIAPAKRGPDGKAWTQLD